MQVYELRNPDQQIISNLKMPTERDGTGNFFTLFRPKKGSLSLVSPAFKSSEKELMIIKIEIQKKIPHFQTIIL